MIRVRILLQEPSHSTHQQLEPGAESKPLIKHFGELAKALGDCACESGDFNFMIRLFREADESFAYLNTRESRAAENHWREF